ncbi:MAG: hypothetical protein WC648_01230 [Candidatus Paceibacterota bacterium]|jgi:hypothetical protein
MAETKKNRAVEIIKDEKAPEVVSSQTQADAQALVDAYAKRSPAKYELKKEALKAWVASFK